MLNTVYGCISFSEAPSNSVISKVGSVDGGMGNGFNGTSEEVIESKEKVQKFIKNYINYRFKKIKIKII